MMPKALYDKNIENIKLQYSDPAARQRALNKLNEAARNWEAPAASPAPVAPITMPVAPGTRILEEQDAKLKDAPLLEKIGHKANMALLGSGIGSLPSLLTGGVGAVSSLARPVIRTAAERGLGPAALQAVGQTAKGAGRILANVVPSAFVANKAGDIAEDLGAGPQLSSAIGNIAAVPTALATNGIVNRFLPQKVPLNVPRMDPAKRTGNKVSQAIHDAVESTLQPGGKAAWYHPQGEEALHQARVYSINRQTDIEAPIKQAFKEIKKLSKGKDQKAVMKSVYDYMLDPMHDVRRLDPSIQTKSIINGINESQKRFADFTDVHELDFRNLDKVLLKGTFKDSKIKKQDMLNHIADIVEGRVAPTPQEVTDLTEIKTLTSRSPRAVKDLVHSLRNFTTKAGPKRGSVPWNEAQKAYLPQMYDYKREGMGWTSDESLLDNAVVEQMLNNNKSEPVVRKMIANITSNRGPGRTIIEPLQATNTKARKLQRGVDDDLQKYLGIIEDPEFLFSEATKRLVGNTSKRLTTERLIKAGLLSRDPEAFKDGMRITTSGLSDMDSGNYFARAAAGNTSAIDTGDEIKGFNYYTPKTFYKAITRGSGTGNSDLDSLARTFGNLTSVGREAKVIQNVPGQIRNAAGDITQQYLSGASITQMPANRKWAFQNRNLIEKGDFAKADPLYRVFREKGIDASGYVRNVVQPMGKDAGKVIASRVGGAVGKAEGLSAKTLSVLQGVPGAKTTRGLAEMSEETGRMAFAKDVFKRFGGNESLGFNRNTAGGRRNLEIVDLVAKEVERVLVPYSRPSALTSAINTAMPVSSWKINASLAAPGIFLENPGRAVALRHGMSAVNDLLEPTGTRVDFNSQLAGGELYEAMDQMNQGIPASVALGDSFKGTLSAGMNPLLRLTEAALLQNTAQGYPVVQDFDPWWKRGMDRIAYGSSYVLPQNYQNFLPYANARSTISDTPGGPAWNALMGVLGQRNNVDEKRTTIPEALARLLGIPIRRDSEGSRLQQVIGQDRFLNELGDVDSESRRMDNQLRKMEVLMRMLDEKAGGQEWLLGPQQ